MKNVRFLSRKPHNNTHPLLRSAIVYAPRLVACCLFLIVQLVPTTRVLGQGDKEGILHAYNLRMEGQFGKAQEILDSIIAEDPKNGMAQYEKGRLLVSSNPFNTEGILAAFGQAVELDPDNAKYVFEEAKATMLGAYIAMHQGDQEKTKAMVLRSCDGFNHVLELDPGCRLALLYLVDIYAGVPEEAGGDRNKALLYQGRLEKVDKLCAARGQLILGQEEGLKESDFWREYISENGNSPQLQDLLFRSLLSEDDIAGAAKVYAEMQDFGSANAEMQLQLARGHMLRVMQGRGDNTTDPEAARKYLLAYVDGDTGQPVCTKAWAYGQLAVISRFQKDDAGFKEYADKAESICPGFSRAFAAPEGENPPDDPEYVYSSFFRPF